MSNRKIAISVFLLILSISCFLYLNNNFDWRKVPIWTSETGIHLFSNQTDEEESFEEFSKFNNSEIEATKFLKFNSTSFEEKCFTTFNRSLNLKYIEKNPKNFEFLSTEEGKDYKTILIYYYAYGKSFIPGSGREPFEASCCKEKRCFVTNDRNIIPVEDFDAVIIHFRSFKKKNLPKKRKGHQRWVFYERESPIYSSRNPQDYEGVFNWTMTYRRDSDIVFGYGEIYNKRDFGIEDLGNSENFSLSLDSVMKTKNKMVAWFVSHCKVPSKRRNYVNNLQKFIPVDIYGKCGPFKCGRKKEDRRCYEIIEKEYKFYLSFENNFCKDYVTEKFFTILNYYIIPVVRGSADYAEIAPPHSYINVDDFKTPKDLAKYLTYLNENHTAYMEYFEWKKDYLASRDIPWLYNADGICTLCQKLHSDKTEKIYYNLKDWFLEEAQCNKNLKSF